MKQISKYICQKVIQSLTQNSEKQIVRIDGFEDLGLYYHVSNCVCEYCLHHGIKPVAKLARAKYEQLKSSAPYEAQRMLQNGWVDTDDRMTYYRNQTPEDGEKMLVLLLGTDMVADKGGLNDFFAITPHTLDVEIVKNYSKLLSATLLDYYPEAEKLKKIVNAFFGELFSCVPKNLNKVSSIMDCWEENPPELLDIIEQLYKSLPDWQVPQVIDRIPSVANLTSEKAKKQTLLTNAFAFIRGKAYARVTKSTLANIEKKFKKYIDEEQKYAIDYPYGQSIDSMEELRKCVLAFVAGDRSPALRQRLLNTDFSIINDVLKVKLDKKQPKEKAILLSGSPLVAITEALLNTVQSERDENSFDRAVVHFKQAQLCGVPSALEEKNNANEDAADAEQILEDTWRSITCFAGGVIPFLNREDWENDGILLDIESEPVDFLDPDATESTRKKGLLKRGTSATHKIDFTIELFDGDNPTAHMDYCWQIQPYEDWMIAFSGLLNMPEDKSYVPFSTMADLNNAFIQKDDENFAYLMDHADIQPLKETNSLVQCWLDRTVSPEEKKEAVHFWKLGECFQNFRQAVLHKGFFNTIDQEAAELIGAYIRMAERITSHSIYTQKLRTLVQMFVNAFSIGETAKPVLSDIFTPQLILPPYHPATLEKLTDSMLFIRAGMKEWFDGENDIGKLHDRIEELTSLSCIHSATDAFFAEANTARSFYKTHGYYTLYGTHLPKTSFVSAQDVQQKETVFEDDFNDRDMKRMTREAKILENVLKQYTQTYPRGYCSLSLAFVNPSNLQIVVASLYKFISDLQKQQEEKRFSLKLTIVSHNELHGARTYLAYWINNVFTADDNLDIKAYMRLYQRDGEIPALIDSTTDVTFFFDALNTDHGATFNFIKNAQTSTECMTDCRFPMVFKPSVAAQGATEHKIVITQPQFRAATAHTQVLKAYRDYEQTSDERYDFIQSSIVDPQRGPMIRNLQERTVWLACIDSAMDKKTVRELYADDTGIIGFTTGEGSFGQLNMAITSKPDTKYEMVQRCQRKLRTMFPSWDKTQLNTAASFCVEKARDLDGVSLLRAMNPNDHDINNYLAYLFASELTKAEEHALNVLIRLDSYRHWFRSNKKEGNKIPDFLQITADITPDSLLHLKATVIESKIANTSTMYAEHLPKAHEQVMQGLELLRSHFEPCPDRPSVEHRYWLAQLYRALVFLQGDIKLEARLFDELSFQLSQMLEGNYEIEWNSRILACKLDSNSHIEKDDYNDVECWNIGQLAMQNLLLKKDPFDQSAIYDNQSSIEEEEKPTLPEEMFFANREKHVSVQTVQTPTVPVQTTATPVVVQEPKPAEPVAPSIVIDEPIPTEENTLPAVTPEPVAPTEEMPLAIEDVRILIGNDRSNRPVHWEFGHKNLANRHLLITGGSGQGKTYAIQTFLYELACQKISSVVFDYTDGFLPDKLEPPFAKALDGKIVQHIAIINRIPINPFKRQTLSIAGLTTQEPSTLVAGRFAAIMKHVYSFGEQQYSALYSACRAGIDTYGDQMDFDKLRNNLEEASTSYAKTVLSKMQQLFDLNLFDTQNAFDWSEITERDGKVTVIQLTNLDREIQTVVTEMLMWDAWYALVKTGTKDHPFVVVLDEAQNLSIADGSPAQKILQEGRKYGWSAWFATQFLKGALSTDEISRLQQAAEVLYFKPSNEEAPWVAQQLASGATPAADWLETIKQMQKGHCIVRGDRIRPNNTFGACPATMVKVSSFEDRN